MPEPFDWLKEQIEAANSDARKLSVTSPTAAAFAQAHASAFGAGLQHLQEHPVVPVDEVREKLLGKAFPPEGGEDGVGAGLASGTRSSAEVDSAEDGGSFFARGVQVDPNTPETFRCSACASTYPVRGTCFGFPDKHPPARTERVDG
jgi:hypothetical protein